ncbi:zinc finger protein 318-like isoform X3 [Acanthopagrus latus]|nr:zinc finger protein 318-like isoform X3 [Acanthopagrus latus]
MEPHRVAAMLSELQSHPHTTQRAGLDAEIKEILHLLGGAAGARAQEKEEDDIDDEEKFLYGDSEEPKPPPASEPLQHHGLDLYGDVTEEALYGDYTPQKASVSQTYGLPPVASPHLQALPTMGEMGGRYPSHPAIGPEQNITVQVSNPTCPPGTEPLEEGERQALEEYEKIQDLLKTIGLDMDMAEISKMAARTKERLHGNKPPPKTPTRRQRYSSDSSDGSRRSRDRRGRSHSSSSSSSSRSRSRGRGGSWSSDDGPGKRSAPPKPHNDREATETKAKRSDPALPRQITPDPNTLPPHPGVPIPTYPPPPVHGMMPPNFPPPGYGQYGNYLPYMHQQWPPMYPPPNMSLPPQTSPDDFSRALPYKEVKSCVQDAEKGKVSSRDRRESEEQNNESQKQKVLEEREKLKQEREVRMKKKEYLMKELERLRKQQGELLRKKRREKGGHKDPLLQEISHLQEDVMTQISNLRKEHEAAEKKRNEIDKVALILGLSPSDRPRKTSKLVEDQEDVPPPPQKEKREAERSPDGRQAASSSTIKQASAVPPPSRASMDKTPICAAPPPPTSLPDPFEYYDAGNHWCKNCNVTSGSMFDFFTHLHHKTHRKTLDPYDRPWASTPNKTVKNTSSEEKLTKPAKGSEFLLPVRGFFCLLCKEFYGDAICAEEHVTTHAHNEKYKKQMYENPLYEQRRNLDRQAGLALETSAKKRKHDDDVKGNKDKDEKSKHKKEKKDKEKKKEEDDTVLNEEKSKVKKEEEERLKPSKREEDLNDARSLEEEKPFYNKEDENEKYKYSKKDDKYRYSREEGERGKFSRIDEDDGYKYSREGDYRYRYRRDEGDRYDDHPRYGPRGDEDKFKHGKYSDFRSKYERERDEGKPKAEKEAPKKLEPAKPVGKPEVTKPEPPPKPYDPPKVFCGPSPAMRAKLRKQSQEAGKPAPSFGKFTWKKKENILATEAQKVAADFIKEDEAAAKQSPVSPEDSFAKSMAVAQEIAQKLGGQPNTTSPWVSNQASRGRIRPNLPGPAAFMRKTAMLGKPAPLNTFLSIRPQNTSISGPPSKDGSIFPEPAPLNTLHTTSPQKTSILGSPPEDGPKFPSPHVKAVNAQNVMLEAKAQPPTVPAKPSETKLLLPESRPAALDVKPAPIQAEPVLSLAKSSPSEAKPASSVATTSPCETTPAPPIVKLAQFEVNSTPPVSKSALFDVNPAPPVSEPTPTEAKPVLSVAQTSLLSSTKPTQPTMMKIVSDVPAPGVPENEQTLTVFVKPPPFMAKGDGAQKSEKLKSNLAAAKRQELFGIFYSSLGQTSASSITKPATDNRSDGNSTNKSQLPTAQAQKPQPQSPSPTQSQPPVVVCTSPQPNSNNSTSHQTQPDIQIASVWSLQSTPAAASEVVPSGTTSQPAQPKLNPPAQSEVQSVPQKQSSTLASVSQSAPQTKPTEPEPPTQTKFQLQLSPQIQTEPQSKPQLEQETQSLSHPPTQSEVHSVPQEQSLMPKSKSQITLQTKPAELELVHQTQSPPKQSPHIQTGPEVETQSDQGTPPLSYPETHPDVAPVPDRKPGPKTRGKRTPPAPCPVRQTRSQTRYQTRQQQSHSEPETVSGDSDSAASDSKGLDTSDPGSGSHPEEGTPCEHDPEMMETTPENIGLPTDMTSLDFETDFNFE